MIDESLILTQNIYQICYDIVKYEIKCKKKIDMRNVLKFVINIFHKYILGTNNVYPGVFLMNKLSCLENNNENNDIKKKLLVEIFVFLAICNKPVNNGNTNTNKKKYKLDECEKILKTELETHRREEIISNCVEVLFKTKKDLLWKVVKVIVHSNKVKCLINYVESLEYMFIKVPKKEFLFEAYKCICSETFIMFFYDNSEYKSIIFQCMMKINYIYSEMGLFDKHMNMYKVCLNCPLHILKEDKNELLIELPEYDEPKEIDFKKTSRISKNDLLIEYDEEKEKEIEIDFKKTLRISKNDITRYDT